MPWNRIPDVEKCCGCVQDLKMAVAIIAVLGIVTSPAVSWAVIRHAYVVRVSCIITSNSTRPDVFDVNLNNVLSFGFAANSGLGPSCLSPQKSDSKIPLVLTVKYLGWVVLFFDIIFLCCSIYLLIFLFRVPKPRPRPEPRSKISPIGKLPRVTPKPRFSPHQKFSPRQRLRPHQSTQKRKLTFKDKLRQKWKSFIQAESGKKAAKRFMISVIVSITLSFIYVLLYVSACVTVGGSFPVFEFIFAFVDVGHYCMWIYFIFVIRSYIKQSTEVVSWTSRYFSYGPWFYPQSWLDWLYSYFFGYLSLFHLTILLYSMGLLFNSSSFLQTQK